MNRNEEESRIQDNNSSKPMDTKQEVAQSPDPKTDQDFPGYPHYPAKEDIMSQDTANHRVDANVEDLAAGPSASRFNERYATTQDKLEQNSMTPRAEGESDNLAAVNSRDSEIGLPQNVSNEDLAAEKKEGGGKRDEE